MNTRVFLRDLIPAVLFVAGLLAAGSPSVAQDAMKHCPIDKDEAQSIKCPNPDGPLRSVQAGAPQRFAFCSLCRHSWSGIELEAGKTYRIQIIGDPERWRDGRIPLETRAKALNGFRKPSEAMDLPWWSAWFYDGLLKLFEGSRPVPDANWFQPFGAVSGAGGAESPPQALTEAGEFEADRTGELFMFVNDHPKYYDNNSGRMILEISLAN